jgi:hypothetical protein
MHKKSSFSLNFLFKRIPVPAALKLITGYLILLLHNFFNFCASLSFFEKFNGIGGIILFFKKALTSLSDIFSIKVFIFSLTMTFERF